MHDGGEDILADAKITPVKGHLHEVYALAMNAYAYCADHPADGHALTKHPELANFKGFSQMGLVVHETESYTNIIPGRGSFIGRTVWVPIERDYRALLNHLAEVLQTLEGPMPEAAPACRWCGYFERLQALAAP